MNLVAQETIKLWAECLKISLSLVNIQFWEPARSMHKMVFILAMISCTMRPLSTWLYLSTIIFQIPNFIFAAKIVPEEWYTNKFDWLDHTHILGHHKIYFNFHCQWEWFSSYQCIKFCRIIHSTVSTTTFSGRIVLINSFWMLQMIAAAEVLMKNGIPSVLNEKILSLLLSLVVKSLTWISGRPCCLLHFCFCERFHFHFWFIWLLRPFLVAESCRQKKHQNRIWEVRLAVPVIIGHINTIIIF